MADMKALLAGTQNPDPVTRQAAEEQLKTMEASDLVAFMHALGAVLMDEQGDINMRISAGVMCKNAVWSKSADENQAKSQRWVATDANQRNSVKGLILPVLQSSLRQARQNAALVISKIASIELPQNQWPELLPLLTKAVTEPQSSPQANGLKEAALTCLGYICEEIATLETDCLNNSSNVILTAVVAGVRDPEEGIKASAIQALANTLEFAKNNFEEEGERNYLMQNMCECSSEPNSPKIRSLGLQCLVRVAELYYDKLQMYMQALFDITINSMKLGKDDEIVKQAIEFWTTVAEAERDRSAAGQSVMYISQALNYLVPELLANMTQQDEDADSNDYTRDKAAGICLCECAAVVKQEILPMVLPWVNENVMQPDWHKREAAILALGQVLDGPDPNTLLDTCQGALPRLMEFLRDENEQVRDTSAYTLGRIAQFIVQAVINVGIDQFVHGILTNLQPNTPAGSSAQTARQLCWSLYSLSEMLYDHEMSIGPAIEQCSAVLLQTAERPDADDGNLRATAYEALNAMTKNAEDNVIPFLEQTMMRTLYERLQGACSIQVVNSDDANKRNELMGLVCSALQYVIQRVRPEFLSQDIGGNTMACSQLMQLLLGVLASGHVVAQEEALLAIGSVANAIGDKFSVFQAHLQPHLVQAISSHDKSNLCFVGATVAGDVARALGGQSIVPYVPQIFEAICNAAVSPEVDRYFGELHTSPVKPMLFSTIGDYMMELGSNSQPYINAILQVLVTGDKEMSELAATVANDSQIDEDTVHYVNSMLDGILNCWTGIIQAARTDPNLKVALGQQVATAMNALNIVSSLEKTRTNTVTNAALGFVGDLCSVYGSDAKTALRANNALVSMVRMSVSSDDEDLRTCAGYASKNLGL